MTLTDFLSCDILYKVDLKEEKKMSYKTMTRDELLKLRDEIEGQYNKAGAY